MSDQVRVEHLWQEMLAAMQATRPLRDHVAAAFASVPRHRFLPHHDLSTVYQDRAIGIKKDTSGLSTSSSSQPTMMAIMIDQLDVQAGQNILEIGTATGYNAAIMQHLVGDKGIVTTVEIDPELAQNAKQHLKQAKYTQVKVVTGDGIQGYAPRAAYDRILSTVGVWDVPPAWLRQLKPQGAVVVPIVLDGIQVSARFVLQADGTAFSRDNRPCSFVYMLGQYAGPDIRRKVGSSNLYILADRVQTIDTAALHLLLSSDQDQYQLEPVIMEQDFWQGYQIHLMLNDSGRFIFVLYSVIEGQQAYGLNGRGIGYFAKSSAAFIDYSQRGRAYGFGGSDAFVEMQTRFDQWHAQGQPNSQHLRLRLFPKTGGQPTITQGKLYDRYDHYLHAWLETDSATS